MRAKRSFKDFTDAYAGGLDDPVTATERALNAAAAPGAEHVFIRLTEARARREAEASRLRWQSGATLGPLDGVPIAVKDLVDMEGETTTAGSATRRGAAPADTDAPITARLSAAGAILIGKTNLSEFAFSGLGLNPHFGTPANASVADAIPGGSSSGSAVAVGIGIVAGAIGTDTSGSIRIPAAFNRITGFRPSRARISQRGVFSLAPNLDSVGPLASCVADLATLDAAMRGAAPTPLPGGRPRLIAPGGVLLSGLDPKVEAAFEAALQTLMRVGWSIERRPVDAIEATARLLAERGSLATWEAAEVHRELLIGGDLGVIDPLVAARLRLGAGMDPVDVAALRAARPMLIHQLAAELGDRLLIAPSTMLCPPAFAACAGDLAEAARLNGLILRNTMILSFLDAPGVSLPVGEAGRPVGLLVSAPSGGDEAVLANAMGLEAALGR